MKPYVHAAFTRGEGFRCDDISDLDQFAARQAALAKALQEKKNQAEIEDFLCLLT